MSTAVEGLNILVNKKKIVRTDTHARSETSLVTRVFLYHKSKYVNRYS